MPAQQRDVVSPGADPELGARILRKLTWRLVPLTALLYLLAYLDRVNVGFAALTMNSDLGLTATTYGAVAGIFSLGYVLLEVPSNIILARVGARRWIARIMISWGFASAAMAFAQGPYSLASLRFLLGVAEAGLLPGILFYLSHWFPVAHRARIMSGFFAAVPITFIIGAPISTALLSLDWLGLRGWQWMFIVEGLTTVLVGIAALRLLIDRPQDARWLDEGERAWLTATLKAEYLARGGADAAPLRQGLMNPRIWLLGIMYFGVISAIGSFAFWLPLIIKSLGGLGNFQIGVISVIPHIAAVIGIFFWSRHSSITGELKWHVCLPIILASAGYALAAWTSDAVLMTVLMCCTVVFVYTVPPIFWTMATRSLNGPAAAASIALINCIASTGAYFGPQVMGYLKDATNSFRPALLVLSAVLALSAILGLRLGRKSSVG